MRNSFDALNGPAVDDELRKSRNSHAVQLRESQKNRVGIANVAHMGSRPRRRPRVRKWSQRLCKETSVEHASKVSKPSLSSATPSPGRILPSRNSESAIVFHDPAVVAIGEKLMRKPIDIVRYTVNCSIAINHLHSARMGAAKPVFCRRCIGSV